MFNVMEIQSLSVNVRFSLIADLQLSYFVRFVPEAEHGDCNLLQDHHEAIFFCYSHGHGKTP